MYGSLFSIRFLLLVIVGDGSFEGDARLAWMTVPFDCWEMPARLHPCIQILWRLAFDCRPQGLH